MGRLLDFREKICYTIQEIKRRSVFIAGVIEMCFIAGQCKQPRIFTTDFTTNQIRIR